MGVRERQKLLLLWPLLGPHCLLFIIYVDKRRRNKHKKQHSKQHPPQQQHQQQQPEATTPAKTVADKNKTNVPLGIKHCVVLATTPTRRFALTKRPKTMSKSKLQVRVRVFDLASGQVLFFWATYLLNIDSGSF